MKKLFVIVFAWSLAFGVAAQQVPEDLKGKTITVVVPWGPGGHVDTVTRTLVQKIENQQPDVRIIVVNKPGASGSIGGRIVADSEPNGLTIGQFTPVDISLNSIRGIPSSVGYKEVVCFHHTIKWGSAIIVNGDAPFNNLKQMIEFLKKDTKPSYGTISLYNTLLAEQLLEEANVKNVIGVNYKSVPDSVRAVLSKEVTFSSVPVSEIVGLVKEGKLKAIVVGTAARNSLLPDVPSITETFKNITIENSLSYCVPRGTPQRLVEYLNSIFDKAAKSQEFVDFLNKRNQTLVGGGIGVANEWYENSWREMRQLNNRFGHLIKN